MSEIVREGLDFSAEFTMTPNRWIRDGRLSLKAAALLMLLMSHRAGWRTSIRQIVAERREGRESIMAGIAELEKYGYLRREQKRDAQGRLGASVWTILNPDADTVVGKPDHGEKPRSEPKSGLPTSGEPESGRSRTKKTNPKNTNPEEHQGNGPAAAEPVDDSPGRPATEKQREYLRDLHLHGGARDPEQIEEWISELTTEQADIEIREALRALGRGRDYQGDPDNPALSPKGREVAQARMIPGRDVHLAPKPAEDTEALF